MRRLATALVLAGIAALLAVATSMVLSAPRVVVVVPIAGGER